MAKKKQVKKSKNTAQRKWVAKVVHVSGTALKTQREKAAGLAARDTPPTVGKVTKNVKFRATGAQRRYDTIFVQAMGLKDGESLPVVVPPGGDELRVRQRMTTALRRFPRRNESGRTLKIRQGEKGGIFITREKGVSPSGATKRPK